MYIYKQEKGEEEEENDERRIPRGAKIGKPRSKGERGRVHERKLNCTPPFLLNLKRT